VNAVTMDQPTRTAFLFFLKYGDPEAWAEFDRAYRTMIQDWAANCWTKYRRPDLVRDYSADLAGDLVADIHKEMRSYDPARHREQPFRHWLAVVTWNLARKWLAKKITEEQALDHYAKELASEESQQRLQESLSGIVIPWEDGKRFVPRAILEQALKAARLRIQNKAHLEILDKVKWQDGRADNQAKIREQLAKDRKMEYLTVCQIISRGRKRLMEELDKLLLAEGGAA
jgi:hypothetical protein